MYSDLRFAARIWRRRPLVAAAAVLTLALGTGANTAIFRVIYAVVLKPLPYAESQRLVQVWSADRDPNAPRTLSNPNKRLTRAATIDEWRKLSNPFAEMGSYNSWEYTLSGDGEPERLTAVVISPGVLPVLRIQPSLGRAFTDQEYVTGKEHAVILSDHLWRRRFAADPAILGRSITLDGYPYAVVGVMPAGLRLQAASLPEDPDIYTPYASAGSGALRPESGYVIGRLKPGVTLAAATSAMEALALRTQHERVRRGINLVPLADEVASGLRPALVVLFAAAGCVLLIACANLANLMLAQAAARRQELAIRAALGASRARLARHLLAECFALAALGAALGIAFSHWMVKAFVALYPQRIPRLAASGAEPAVFTFTLLVAAVTAILFGAFPAWRFSRPAISGTLREARHGSAFRGLLVVAQVAAAVVLLTGAGLLLRSFQLQHAIDPGYSRSNLLIAQLWLPDKVYNTPERQARFASELLDRVRSLPAVQSAAITNCLPIVMHILVGVDVKVPGGPASPSGENAPFVRAVTPGYFQTLGIGLLAGRYLEPRDDNGGAVVVNRTFASRYFGDSSPVGRRMQFSIRGKQHEVEVVGVVPDTRDLKLQVQAQSEFYVAFASQPWSFQDLAIRTAADPGQVAKALRVELAAVDRNLPLGPVGRMEKVLSNSVAMPKFDATLVGTFAALALLLAAVGIYGVIAYSVSLRTREIGIRVALGARPGDVVRMVLRRGLMPPLAGLAVGIPLALAATRALASLLYGVQPVDATTYAAVSAVVFATSVVAAWVPARRAMSVDPMAALRCE